MDEIYQKETDQNKDLEDEFIYKVCKKEENNKKEKLPHVKRFSDIYIERIKRAIERLERQEK